MQISISSMNFYGVLKVLNPGPIGAPMRAPPDSWFILMHVCD